MSGYKAWLLSNTDMEPSNKAYGFCTFYVVLITLQDSQPKLSTALHTTPDESYKLS
jgi:hypothetical protein